MSGGSYSYAFSKLEELADDIESIRNDHKSVRFEVANLLREVSKICHDIEWIDSGDYGEDGWKKYVIPRLKKIKSGKIGRAGLIKLEKKFNIEIKDLKILLQTK